MSAGLGQILASRRFIIAPVLALFLLGMNAEPIIPLVPSGTPAPSATTPTAGSKAEVDAAKELLQKAHDAEQVYYVDNLVFLSAVGAELAQLQQIEPGVTWGQNVVVEIPAAEHQDSPIVVLRADLGSRGSLCMAEVTTEEDAGTWYSSAPAGATCQRPARGMPGWTTDSAAGWTIPS